MRISKFCVVGLIAVCASAVSIAPASAQVTVAPSARKVVPATAAPAVTPPATTPAATTPTASASTAAAPASTTAAPALAAAPAAPARKAARACMRLPLSDIQFGREYTIKVAREKLEEYAQKEASKRGWKNGYTRSTETATCENYLWLPIGGQEYKCLVTATFCQK